ncbi:hypothetical protein N3K66_008616 [Trichothecium roseum]|uniref:Uncharacterized protein n=1 Tax=Trichothecium roseum TaxID=47278 RepID=A0ACC0USG0_9HYPO|nr:hypothetical protein N3K66_008616 [Trichothecium roseum]
MRLFSPACMSTTTTTAAAADPRMAEIQSMRRLLQDIQDKVFTPGFDWDHARRQQGRGVDENPYDEVLHILTGLRADVQQKYLAPSSSSSSSSTSTFPDGHGHDDELVLDALVGLDHDLQAFQDDVAVMAGGYCEAVIV